MSDYRQQPEEDLQFIARTAGLDSAEYPRILINEK